MALPVTIGSAPDIDFPLRNYYCGPFISSGGNVYVVIKRFNGSDNITVRNRIAVFKATDPTSSFSEQDRGSASTPNAPMYDASIVREPLQTMWAVQVSDVLHVAWTSSASGALDAYEYTTFDMSSDTWSGTELVIDTVATDPPVLTDTSISIAVRSDGDVIALYNGATDRLHGSDQNRVDYARKENGTFATIAVAVDNAGADMWYGSVIVLGSSDRMHFFFKNDDLDDAYQRTLVHSGNALETFPSAGDTQTNLPNHVFAPGISYNDGGTQRVRCPYVDLSGQLSYAEFDSVDAPGAFTVNADVGDNDVISPDQNPVACLAVDGTDEHLLYSGGGASGTDRDLYHDLNDGVDVEILDGVTVNSISCNVYDRTTNVRLAYVYDDGGTIKYNEVDLGALASGSLPPVQSWSNRSPHLRM